MLWLDSTHDFMTTMNSVANQAEDIEEIVVFLGRQLANEAVVP